MAFKSSSGTCTSSSGVFTSSSSNRASTSGGNSSFSHHSLIATPDFSCVEGSRTIHGFSLESEETSEADPLTSGMAWLSLKIFMVAAGEEEYSAAETSLSTLPVVSPSSFRFLARNFFSSCFFFGRSSPKFRSLFASTSFMTDKINCSLPPIASFIFSSRPSAVTFFEVDALLLSLPFCVAAALEGFSSGAGALACFGAAAAFGDAAGAGAVDGVLPVAAPGAVGAALTLSTFSFRTASFAPEPMSFTLSLPSPSLLASEMTVACCPFSSVFAKSLSMTMSPTFMIC
mmetsp:Transcript_75725/g.131183  ORF Transcript_75725/g.131183 Transcript_75725/m.131183 type:complete len:287 (+) Transcript_75725:337-1197(+)